MTVGQTPDNDLEFAESVNQDAEQSQISEQIHPKEDTPKKREINPDDFEPQTHRMDPETEDLILGRELVEGMKVLVEDRIGYYTAKDAETNDHAYDSLMRTNRWCVVSKLRRNTHNGDLIQFIGIYEDGTKLSRTYNESYCWFVKLDSIDGPPETQVDGNAGPSEDIEDPNHETWFEQEFGYDIGLAKRWVQDVYKAPEQKAEAQKFLDKVDLDNAK